MDMVRFGQTGLQVSKLCLGCMSFGEPERGPHPWTLKEEDSRPLIRRALEQGINFFDTANMYSAGSSEEIVGRALKDMARRDEIVVATKAYFPWCDAPNAGGLSRKALFHAVDDSLARLRMDYVDLLQIHRWDDLTPIEETMEALHDIVKSGRARYIGASSMFAWQLAKANYTARAHGWTPFASMQNHLNLLYREEQREMLPFCADQGMAVIPWSPLARGRLARAPDAETARTASDEYGKTLYTSMEAADAKIVAAVGEVATELDIPRAQVALAWVMHQPEVTSPIVGATKPVHLDDAVAATAVRLTKAQIDQLEAAYLPHPVTGMASPRTPGGKVSLLASP